MGFPRHATFRPMNNVTTSPQAAAPVPSKNHPALAETSEIRVFDLIESRQGEVAIDLARWISAPFAVWLAGLVPGESPAGSCSAGGNAPPRRREVELIAWAEGSFSLCSRTSCAATSALPAQDCWLAATAPSPWFMGWRQSRCQVDGLSSPPINLCSPRSIPTGHACMDVKPASRIWSI